MSAAEAISGQSNGLPAAAPSAEVAGARRLRVLLADDDGLARSMIRTAINEDDRIAIVLNAANSREALELASYYHPDVIIADTAIPPAGCLPLINDVLRIAPRTRILTTAVNDHQTAIAALRTGAIGHIDKDTNPETLAQLVIRAADGEAIVPQALIIPMLKLLRDVPDTGWRPLHSRLTTREWEILDLLAQNASTQTIAEQLVLSPTTIYSHIKNVLRKLDVHTRRDAITAAQRLRREEVLGSNSKRASPHSRQGEADIAETRHSHARVAP
jgi:DNA-binding NarL/FixJ family response regulator